MMDYAVPTDTAFFASSVNKKKREIFVGSLRRLEIFRDLGSGMVKVLRGIEPLEL